MIGKSGGQSVDLSQYLVNFNSSDWANRANSYLQSALSQGLGYGEQYNQAAIDAVQAYNNQAQQALESGYQRAQAVQAPQRMAAYNALDAYQDTLGLARPTIGSFGLASALENQANPNIQASVPQQQTANAFNQGLLGPVQKGV